MKCENVPLIDAILAFGFIILLASFLAGCHQTTGTLPGENFSRAGSCGTQNQVEPAKPWGCLLRR